MYGIGTDRSGNVFMGTYVKRHTGCGPAGNANAIYRANVNGGGVSVFTLPGTLTRHSAAAAVPCVAADPAAGRELCPTPTPRGMTACVRDGGRS